MAEKIYPRAGVRDHNDRVLNMADAYDGGRIWTLAEVEVPTLQDGEVFHVEFGCRAWITPDAATPAFRQELEFADSTYDRLDGDYPQPPPGNTSDEYQYSNALKCHVALKREGALFNADVTFSSANPVTEEEVFGHSYFYNIGAVAHLLWGLSGNASPYPKTIGIPVRSVSHWIESPSNRVTLTTLS